MSVITGEWRYDQYLVNIMNQQKRQSEHDRREKAEALGRIIVMIFTVVHHHHCEQDNKERGDSTISTGTMGSIIIGANDKMADDEQTMNRRLPGCRCFESSDQANR
jgi:HD-like signal output (HDOD) protein